ncbi:hypothetical protein M422DRAFT_776784 [Sphaerobolus stellatus SS14]|nr:hypothetical protein M422DRAFT_776784 [Sphaerobolus stellatus SS14]
MVSKRMLEVEDSRAAKRWKFYTDRAGDVRRSKEVIDPSTGATLPILNGCPSEIFGPPIGLFHLVFDQFQVIMKSGAPFYADPGTYKAVKALFQASANIYDSEDGRTQAITPVLIQLLGSAFTSADLENSESRSEDVIIQLCDTLVAYILIREINNEIEAGGADPYNQGALVYRKYWAEVLSELPSVNQNSYCPSIILAIACPWLCIAGAVYVERVVVQPLTNYICLGDGVFNDDRLHYVSRLFYALKLNNPEFFPDKLIHKAKDKESGRILVVKFVTTYNTEAHRLLASHHLAPALLYSGLEDPTTPKYGGRYMIVMHFVEGEAPTGPRLSEDTFQQVKRAVELLHSRDLVF